MTKSQFKKRWKSEGGGGITFNDIAKCAIEWGVHSNPLTSNILEVGNKVLIAAGLDPHWDVKIGGVYNG